MIADSRAGSSPRMARCGRMSLVQSGIFCSGDLVHGAHERYPRASLLLQHLASCCRELVIAAAPLAGFFNPAALDEPASLQPVKQRIKPSNVEAQHAALPRVNEPAALITVPRPPVDPRHD